MEKKCKNCGNSYNTELTPEIGYACPICMAKLLMEDGLESTIPMDPKERGSIPTPGTAPLQPGSTFHGMEIKSFLGQGAMGYVYKARQLKLDRTIALKILNPQLAKEKEFTERFNREAKALAALNHPAIVQVYDYGHEDDLYFLSMEFVEGASLREILATQRLAPEEALRYVPQICDALDYAHSNGVIHRDIKPENILLDTNGSIKIADFGLAKMKTAETTQLTMSGRVMGTRSYMAPEQYKELASVDHRADIYSLGVVFYEMLTGELPIGRFPAPSESVQVNVSLDQVVLKALENDPKRRYQHASEVKDDVNRTTTADPAQRASIVVSAGGSDPGKAAPPLIPSPSRKRKLGKRTGLFLACFSLSISLGVFLFLFGGGSVRVFDVIPGDSEISFDVSTITEKRLFPLSGLILGEASKDQLAALGKKHPKFDHYVVDGFNFWYDANNTFHDMALMRGEAIPQRWRDFGFDWRLSYRQWMALLEHQGFEISIANPPEVMEYRGHGSFSAKVAASRRAPTPLSVILKFKYSKGTTDSARGTLYSIKVRADGTKEVLSDEIPFDVSRITEKRLFPISGLTIGQASKDELAAQGARDGENNLYIIDGFKFWYDKNNTFDRVYLSRGGPIPQRWRDFGFDWRLSYRQWMALLEHQGFEISIANPPEVKKYQGRDAFTAKVVASRREPTPLSVTLDFNYNTGITDSARGTLHNIKVHADGTQEVLSDEIPFDVSTTTERKLFPLSGLMIGQASKDQLAALGKKDAKYDFYVIDGFNFWYDENNTFDHMYLVRGGALPQRWRDFGFDWRLSYQQWVELLKHHGFAISIANPPEVKEYKGHGSFSAKVAASRREPTPLSVILDFNYSKGVTDRMRDTLYSIKVRSSAN